MLEVGLLTIRTYSELIRLPTFNDRFQYVCLNGMVGEMTFGGHRQLNQDFYRSAEWRRVRREVIVRDNACDLAVEDRPISGMVIVHHLNPIAIEDFDLRPDTLLDPEFLVCVSDRTHKALTFGDETLLPKDYVPRRQNDTCPWK